MPPADDMLAEDPTPLDVETVEDEEEFTDDLIGDPLPDEDAATDALLKGTLDLAAALADEEA